METTLLLPTMSASSSDFLRLQRRRRLGCALILISQFFERTAFYSLLCNLSYFLNSEPFHWNASNAMAAAFLFTGITYVSALLGGFMADVHLAKYKTIFIGYMCYLFGYIGIPLMNIQNVSHWANNTSVPDFCRYFGGQPPEEDINPIMVTLVPAGPVVKDAYKIPLFYQETCSGFVGLALIFVGVGCGLIKSVVAPFGADQLRYEAPGVIRSFFNWFYWVINSGTFIAYFIFAFVQQNISPLYGYSAPMILLIISAVVFIAGHSFYSVRPAPGTVCNTVFGVLFEAFKRRFHREGRHRGSTIGEDHFGDSETSGSGDMIVPRLSVSSANDSSMEESKRPPPQRQVTMPASESETEEETHDATEPLVEERRPQSIAFLDYAKVRHGGNYHESMVEDVKTLGRILLVLLCFIPYWMVYFQMESAFVIQGLHMKLNIFNVTDPKSYFNMIPVSWLSLFDVVMLIILLPCMDRLVYPWLDRRGCSPSLHLRIGIGMLVAIGAVCLAGLIEYKRLEVYYSNTSDCQITQSIGGTKYNAANLSVLWQIPQYLLIGISEAFTSVAGLEYAYSKSPKSMQSLINGVYWFISGSGSFLGVALLVMFRGVFFFDYDNGNINCRNVVCSPGSKRLCDCHMDYYFYVLAGIQGAGFLLFVLTVYCFSRSGRESGTNRNSLYQSINVKNILSKRRRR